MGFFVYSCGKSFSIFFCHRERFALQVIFHLVMPIQQPYGNINKFVYREILMYHISTWKAEINFNLSQFLACKLTTYTKLVTHNCVVQVFYIFTSHPLYRYVVYRGGSRIPRRRGCQPSMGRRQDTNFPKNCMKLRNFWFVGGHPLWIRH